jgi:glycerate-2-kinase
VDGVEPTRLVRAALWTGAVERAPSNSLFVVAAGKAAWSMACAFAECEGPRVATGLIAGPEGTRPLPARFTWYPAAHPSPDAASEEAGRQALSLAARSRTGILVVLLSGGASAMLCVPAAGLTRDDKAATARALMLAGVAIADLNCVRKHLSAIKGGRLGAAARRSVTMAISDVHGPVPDDSSVIGSGPTVADPTTFAEALSVVERAGVVSIPPPVLSHLRAGARGETEDTPKPGDPRLAAASYEVIASRQTAVDAASRAASGLGYRVHVFEPATTGEARYVGERFAAAAAAVFREGRGPVCVIGSGETTVTVAGGGRGGRNQEFALGALPVVDTLWASSIAAAAGSAGTDGIDGPTDAAGALVDSRTSARAAATGASAELALARNASYDFFDATGDLIVWGPTGTNVGDIHVMLIGDPPPRPAGD